MLVFVFIFHKLLSFFFYFPQDNLNLYFSMTSEAETILRWKGCVYMYVNTRPLEIFF